MLTLAIDVVGEVVVVKCGGAVDGMSAGWRQRPQQRRAHMSDDKGGDMIKTKANRAVEVVAKK